MNLCYLLNKNIDILTSEVIVNKNIIVGIVPNIAVS